jgi:hypothetical protein
MARLANGSRVAKYCELHTDGCELRLAERSKVASSKQPMRMNGFTIIRRRSEKDVPERMRRAAYA